MKHINLYKNRMFLIFRGRYRKVSLDIKNEKIKPNKNIKKISLSKVGNVNLKHLIFYPKSKKEAPLCTLKKASFTLEAAVVLPLLAGFFVSVLFFFQVLMIQQEVEKALEYTGRKMAVLAYGEEEGKMPDLAEAEFIFARELKESNCPMRYVKGNHIYLDMHSSSVKGNYIWLYTGYQVQLPIGFFGKTQILVTQSVKTRKWTGYQGINEEENADGFVYVTEHGSVYHESLNCAYLDLSIQSVSVNEVENLRNKDGAKYYSCASCKGDTGNVYITDYGTCYHTSLSCSGLKRTVHLIRKSEAGNYGACSKCTNH